LIVYFTFYRGYNNSSLNASEKVIYKAQTAFEGIAEKMSIHNEDDVQALVNEVRYGKD
jgi:hypothetical protein